MKSIPDFENDDSLTKKQKSRRREYYANRQKAIKQSKEWYRNNRDRHKEWLHNHRRKHIDRFRKYSREYMKKRRESKGKEWRQGQYDKYREAGRAASRVTCQRLKREAIDAYGGSCACCGENMIEFLSIDHVNNDGAEHRRKAHHGSGVGLYRFLKNNNYPKGIYQVLCYNCNMAKGVLGVCPHQILASSMIGVKLEVVYSKRLRANSHGDQARL